MNNLLPVRNGKFYDFNSESVKDKLIKEPKIVCPVQYDPDAKSEVFDQFIDDFALGRQDIKDCLQEFFGMSLMGDSSMIHKKFLHLCGEGGNNGKTVLLRTIQRLMGLFSITIENNLEDYNVLMDKRLVVLNEADEPLNTGLVKRLTGGDLVYMSQISENYKLQCKLVYVSNMKIDFSEDKTMNDRCIYIPCLMEAVSNPTEKHQRQRDIYLLDKLNNHEVLSSVLNWLIAGALRFKRQGLTEPKL